MQAKLLTLVALVAAASAARPNYSFGYTVSDPRNDFGHQESRQLENTEGGYHVALPDGRLQQVAYRVNGDSGYLVEVTYEGEARFPDSDESFESSESFESREFQAPHYSQDSSESSESRVFSVPKPVTFIRPSTSRSSNFFNFPRSRVSSSRSFVRPSSHRRSSSGRSRTFRPSRRTVFNSLRSPASSGSSSYFRLGSSDFPGLPFNSLESSERRLSLAPRHRRVFDHGSSESLEFSSGSGVSRDHRYHSGDSVDHFRTPQHSYVRVNNRYAYSY